MQRSGLLEHDEPWGWRWNEPEGYNRHMITDAEHIFLSDDGRMFYFDGGKPKWKPMPEWLEVAHIPERMTDSQKISC